MTRGDLNCKRHAPGTDGFKSLLKDAAQDAPTQWVEQLNGHLTVQVVPTHWVETMSKCTKLQLIQNWPITTMTSCSLVSCQHSLRASWSINVINWVEHSVPSSSWHKHPAFKNHAIISYSSSVSLCSTTISPISNPPLQTMSAAAVMLLQHLWRQTPRIQIWWMSRAPLRGKRRRVWNMTLDRTLFYGCVCIVHMNNSTSITV